MSRRPRPMHPACCDRRPSPSCPRLPVDGCRCTLPAWTSLIVPASTEMGILVSKHFVTHCVKCRQALAAAATAAGGTQVLPCARAGAIRRLTEPPCTPLAAANRAAAYSTAAADQQQQQGQGSTLARTVRKCLGLVSQLEEETAEPSAAPGLQHNRRAQPTSELSCMM